MKPLILTYTGKQISPLDLRPEDICIEDIAHALALCNRFAGHSSRPLSVAQHSVYVSRLCGNGPEGIQALLHDASEAYLGDVTKWVKATPAFDAYCQVEDHIQKQIYEHFGCPTEMYPDVTHADKVMLRFEGEMAFGHKRWKEWIAGLTNYDLITPQENIDIGPWGFWSWQQSERGFLDRAKLLGLTVRPARVSRTRRRN